MASRSPMISSSSAPLAPSHSAMRSRTRRSSPRKLCSTSRKSASSSRASCANCWKRSFSAVSSSSGTSPASTRAISASISSRRLLQLGDALGRVGLAALAHLLQQLEQRQQARLGADEAALGERAQPGDRLLGGRRQVEVRLVRALAGRTCAASPLSGAAQSFRYSSADFGKASAPSCSRSANSVSSSASARSAAAIIRTFGTHEHAVQRSSPPARHGPSAAAAMPGGGCAMRAGWRSRASHGPALWVDEIHIKECLL